MQADFAIFHNFGPRLTASRHQITVIGEMLIAKINMAAVIDQSYYLSIFNVAAGIIPG